jgi:glycosyltransferase involved in cell wall biosynthesis
VTLRIALVATQAANAYMDNPTGGVGGIEVQYRLLAAHLAHHAQVAVVLGAPPPGAVLRGDPGVELVPIPRATRRGVGRQSRLLWKALREARADVYLQSGAGIQTLLTALYARLHGKRAIYHWASDADRDGSLMAGLSIERRLFRLGRWLADWQLCQTERQASFLGRREARRASLLPNLLDSTVAWRLAHGPDVLWVGNIKPEAKRPDRFLDLAAALPHRRFRMVGELRGPPAFKAEMRERIAALPNVAWVGFVPRPGLPSQYEHARCLVNTSDTEGFSNTFLEAFASGVPVVSLNVDPNGVLARQGAGAFLDGDVAGLPAAIERMFGEPAWSACRAACLRVAREHDPDALARRVGHMATALRRGGRAAARAATRAPPG